MKGIVTVIYNKVEDCYSAFDVCTNEIVAKRRFADGLKSDKVMYKSDFELYKVADVSLETFEISNPNKVLIATYDDIAKED